MIRIETRLTDSPLTGQSKWWGEPDMPESLDYPEVKVQDEDGEEWSDPLTFVCQIRCEDIAPFDTEELLPHDGMLYFFATLDYFLGDTDTPAYPGMGMWLPQYYRVLYAPTCEGLHTHHVVDEQNRPVNLPAEAISFSSCEGADDSMRLLGVPYIEEVRAEQPGMISLLQVDESDCWSLVFHDCGMLNFLIAPDDLRQRRWDNTKCYLFSF